MKIIFQIIFLFVLTILITACKFPDNLPDVNHLKNYKLNKLKFGKTTISEFEKITGYKISSKNGIAIVDAHVETNLPFKKIRIGFVNKKLDWIEFELLDKPTKLEIIKIYGEPDNINNSYSKTYDYYEYGKFSFSSLKSKDYFSSLNLFGLPIDDKTKKNSKKIKINFNNIEVGKTLEVDFKTYYSELDPAETVANTIIYNLNEDILLTGNIKNINLKFNGGLLSWVSIIPKDLKFENVPYFKEKQYKIEKKAKVDFYIYDDFILTISKHNNKVLNIGVINGKLSEILNLRVLK